VFDKTDVEGQMEDLNEMYKRLQDFKSAVYRMFVGVEKGDLDAVMSVIEPENKREEFEMAYVRAGAKARFEPEKEIDIADCGEKAREIISEHLKAQGVIQWIRPISLHDKDFDDKMNSLKSDEAVASSMEHAIRHTISIKMEDNPVHYTSLLERLQQLLDDTKVSWEERRARLKEFIDRELEESKEDEAFKLGFESKKDYAFYLKIKEVLNEETTDVFGAVAETPGEYLSDSKVELYKDMTKDVVETIKSNRLDGFATNKAKADQVEKAIQSSLMTAKYHKFGYKKLKQLVNPMLELAKRHFATESE